MPVWWVMSMSGRRMGVPRTDEDRRTRHDGLHPREKLPPRGTGLKIGTAAGSRGRYPWAELLLALLVFACVSAIDFVLFRRARESRDS